MNNHLDTFLDKEKTSSAKHFHPHKYILLLSGQGSRAGDGGGDHRRAENPPKLLAALHVDLPGGVFPRPGVPDGESGAVWRTTYSQ